jgi:prophage antirepressor-like protein
MNEIQIFNNPEFGEIRTLETTDGKVLFCGKDVAAALGYSNQRDALARHCKGVVKCDTLTNGGKQELAFITESDVYRLTFGSKLPTAEKFTDWVTEVVLPSIRKTGNYTAKPVDELKAKRLEIMERNATARQAKVMLEFAKMGLSQASIELLANGATMLMTGQKLLPEPVVEETFTAAEVGVQIGVSGNMVGRIANANGVKCEKYGMRVLDTAKNGKQIPTFRYNKAGVERIRELVKMHETNHHPDSRTDC